MVKHVLVFLIGIYQKTLSPDHGMMKIFFPNGCCIHSETCSEYAKRVIKERGTLVGTALSFKRLLSCHPWGKAEPRS